ncbi:MAG: sulfite exporter TauE/SafE family protein [Gammaproteobacteria bacterium]|nr:sulfite exporter TauE/SafE family protein [Gammaproteobacteria bacterium]
MPITSVEFSITIAFLVGIASTLHCVGMCSGIAGGLSVSLPHQVRLEKQQHLSFLLAYNIGRITSYAIAGALAGLFSSTLFDLLNPALVHLFVHLASTLILALIALYLMGIFPKFSSLQYLGKPLWKYLEPLGRKLLPVKTLPKAFYFGIVWGWLPCGLVYSILVWSMTSGSIWYSALVMFSFGLGTIPTLLVAGYLSTYLLSINKLPVVRGVIGCTLLVVAIFYLFKHGHVNMLAMS